MYAALCRAADQVIEPLQALGASEQAEILQKALLEAEEIYLNTTENADCRDE